MNIFHGSLLALVIAALLAATATTASDATSIQVVRHRWHTGIVVPATDNDALSFLNLHFGQPAYYEIGWGDSAFYQQPDSLWLMVRALFWPTDSVLHVVALPRPAAALPHTDLAEFCVSSSQLARLKRSLARSFDDQGSAKAHVLAKGLYGESLFFAATGKFWFGKTCNNWTAGRLRNADIPLKGILTLTADQLLRAIRKAHPQGGCGGD